MLLCTPPRTTDHSVHWTHGRRTENIKIFILCERHVSLFHFLIFRLILHWLPRARTTGVGIERSWRRTRRFHHNFIFSSFHLFNNFEVFVAASCAPSIALKIVSGISKVVPSLKDTQSVCVSVFFLSYILSIFVFDCQLFLSILHFFFLLLQISVCARRWHKKQPLLSLYLDCCTLYAPDHWMRH